MNDPAYRKVINAWAMYDWANSAFATTVMAAFFPPFYRFMAIEAGASESEATAYWGYTTSCALFIIALIGPLLGIVSDQMGGRKRFIAAFAGLGILSCGLFVFLGDDSYLLGSALFVLANIGFAGANIFYESLLPHIARSDDIDQVSTRGYAIGYIGGGILLAVNAIWYTNPDWFFMPDTGFAVRAAFFSVALWWALFSIPLFRTVPEPPVAEPPASASPRREPDSARPARRLSALAAAFRRLFRTFREITRYRQLLMFLIAFWLYNDGIGTIIKMAVAYGDEIGIDVGDMVAALVITQFVGIPCAFGFGRLARLVSTKRAILIGLFVYTGISIGGFFVQTATHFYILAFLVGTVQGGTQGLSRSLYASMVPKERAAEFFGFYSTSSRFAGIAGPLIFGLITEYGGTGRLGILALVVFFVGGGLLLTMVDEKEGMQIARE